MASDFDNSTHNLINQCAGMFSKNRITQYILTNIMYSASVKQISLNGLKILKISHKQYLRYTNSTMTTLNNFAT